MPTRTCARALALLGVSALAFPATSSAANILLYESNSAGYAGNALDRLGLTYTTASSSNFTTLVSGGTYDLLVLDMPSTLPSGAWQSAIATHVSGGGMAIMGFWRFQSEATLQSAFQCGSTSSLSTPQSVYEWDSAHPIFNTPYTTPNPTRWTSDSWADDGDYLSPSSGATAVAGYSASASSTAGAIVVGNSDRTIYNGFLFDSFRGDDNANGIPDIEELIANEVSYLLGVACDSDGDGYDATGSCGGSDCDDTDPAVNPGASEECDGIDNDCDGTVDEDDAIDVLTWYRDSDVDGYGDASVTDLDCTQPSGYVADNTDCDDSVASTYPGADEYCNGVDDDCDGTVDEDAAVDAATWYRDSDSDGYGDAATTDLDCSQPSGYVTDNTDCDDTVATTYPGADEYCNGVDDDCDGAVDEDSAVDAVTWYRDADSDSYGDPSVTDLECSQPSGYVADNTDCDDTVATTYPGADEYCNGVDDDCDGDVDEDDAVDVATWYRDADSDSYGDFTASDIDCDQPSGYVADDTDCDDTDPATYPGAPEVPYDGIDQDCSGSDLCDADVDGFDAEECGGDDCDDEDADIRPDATELWYDGVDQDCDEWSDYDADLDGFDSATYDGEDCDDADPDTYPGAPDEPYDGIITDCDDSDEYDADGDGFDAAEYGGDDCDDNNSAINPDGAETWYDGIDQDCDGNDDDQDEDGYALDDDCDDTDADSYPDNGFLDDECNEPSVDTGGLLEDIGSATGGGGLKGCSDVKAAGFLGSIGLLLFGLARRRED